MQFSCYKLQTPIYIFPRTKAQFWIISFSELKNFFLPYLVVFFNKLSEKITSVEIISLLGFFYIKISNSVMGKKWHT